MKVELNRFWRAQMEQACRREQEERVARLAAEWTEYLTALAQRRLTEEWGRPDIQADMLILQRYHKASEIKRAIIRVQNAPGAREGDYYYRNSFGVELKTDILKPGDGHETAYDFYVGHADPGWPRLRAMVEERDTYKDRQREEYKAFQQFIRSTSSIAKIFAQCPWLAERMRPMLPAAA